MQLKMLMHCASEKQLTTDEEQLVHRHLSQALLAIATQALTITPPSPPLPPIPPAAPPTLGAPAKFGAPPKLGPPANGAPPKLGAPAKVGAPPRFGAPAFGVPPMPSEPNSNVSVRAPQPRAETTLNRRHAIPRFILAIRIRGFEHGASCWGARPLAKNARLAGSAAGLPLQNVSEVRPEHRWLTA